MSQLGRVDRNKLHKLPPYLEPCLIVTGIRIHYWRFSDAGFLIHLRRVKPMRSGSVITGKALAMFEV